jgi:hypothetical protein
VSSFLLPCADRIDHSVSSHSIKKKKTKRKEHLLSRSDASPSPPLCDIYWRRSREKRRASNRKVNIEKKFPHFGCDPFRFVIFVVLAFGDAWSVVLFWQASFFVVGVTCESRTLSGRQLQLRFSPSVLWNLTTIPHLHVALGLFSCDKTRGVRCAEMPKRRVKVSSFYRSDGTSATTSPVLTGEPHGALACFSGDFDETLPYEAKVKRNRFRDIEDVMDYTGREVDSEHFRAIEDIMNSTGRKVKESHFRTIEDIMNLTEQKVKGNHFRSIVDIMSSSGPIKATEDGALVSYEEEFGKIVPYEGKVKRKHFWAKVDTGKEYCLDEETKKLRGRIDSFMDVMDKVQGIATISVLYS